MLAALLLVAILAGSVSALGGALLGHVGWISLGLYTGGGLSGMAVVALLACLAPLRIPDQPAATAPEATDAIPTA
jgi:hypothetical protein